MDVEHVLYRREPCMMLTTRSTFLVLILCVQNQFDLSLMYAIILTIHSSEGQLITLNDPLSKSNFLHYSKHVDYCDV